MGYLAYLFFHYLFFHVFSSRIQLHSYGFTEIMKGDRNYCITQTYYEMQYLRSITVDLHPWNVCHAGYNFFKKIKECVVKIETNKIKISIYCTFDALKSVLQYISWNLIKERADFSDWREPTNI